MPHVSRIKLDKQTEKKLIDTLELILTKIGKSSEMNQLLASLLTPTERLMIAKRIAIVILLKENLNDSQIASALHVTRITVSRLRYFLEARGEGYDVALKVLKNEKLLNELKSTLSKLVAYTVRAAGGYVKPEVF